MEAPEKIYVQKYDTDTLICLNEYNIDEEWTEKPINGTTVKNIEYTRTDAFIEKAWNWIEDNLLSSNQQDKSRLYFEQFKNYIKE